MSANPNDDGSGYDDCTDYDRCSDSFSSIVGNLDNPNHVNWFRGSLPPAWQQPDVNWSMPLRFSNSPVSAQVSRDKLSLLENGVLRARTDYSITTGDVVNLEKRGDLYVVSVRHDGDEFPTPMLQWRPEPEDIENPPSRASWWLGWLAMGLLTVTTLTLLVWAMWTFVAAVTGAAR